MQILQGSYEAVERAWKSAFCHRPRKPAGVCSERQPAQNPDADNADKRILPGPYGSSAESGLAVVPPARNEFGIGMKYVYIFCNYSSCSRQFRESCEQTPNAYTYADSPQRLRGGRKSKVCNRFDHRETAASFDEMGFWCRSQSAAAADCRRQKSSDRTSVVPACGPVFCGYERTC